MRRKESAFIVAQAAIFVGIIALVSLPVESASQVSTSQTQAVSGWQVVRNNLTVYGMPAYLGRCDAPGIFCPTLSTNMSLTPVSLVIYEGTYYYSYTGNITITEVGVSQNTTTYTAWFTNSTLYCVTGFDTATITCPGTSEVVKGNALGSDGLQLFVSLNSSELAPGQALQVNVSIFNTLSTPNVLQVSDGFPFQGIPLAVWPDCDSMLLGSTTVGFEVSVGAEAVVLKGDYTMANISSVADVHFVKDACPEGPIKVEQVTFGPRSEQANLTGPGGYDSPNDTLGPYYVLGTFNTNGSWDLQSNSERASVFLDYEGQQTIDSPVTTPFTPGIYTVGVEDVWGQAVILHFSVEV